MTRSANDVRAAFLSFFEKNGHAVLPSSSLVPLGDPTLMFTNAGMNQFKNIFTGNEKAPAPRAATSQKCVRAGGKHNDLDNVGYTARHHTFFEMLGNFSFGDYFKEDAIALAWELLTKTYGLPPEKLLVTIYHDDDEAFGHWKKITGFPDSKIIRIATSDNFWSMGDTGPCGPCSEIFYDHGDKIPGGPPGSADADGDRFVEIWNLVFMQFDQQGDGSRVALPKPSIDTGMGLERITAVIQGVHDNYDIDLFRQLIGKIKASAAETGGKPAADPAPYKVIADHLRASGFLIADGVMPSNEGRGYVLRRIMRRAMRYAHQLGCTQPLMHHLVPALVDEMGGQYPELSRAQATIAETLRGEEERFKETLGRGLKLLEEESAAISKGGKLSGESAFKLYDTYGFPLDLTQDILRARGIGVDVEGFERCMEGQREMARAAWSGSGEKEAEKIWFGIKEKLGTTEFVGYGQDAAEAKVLFILPDEGPITAENILPKGKKGRIVLDTTPFYGESGGQVGDTGWFYSSLRAQRSNREHNSWIASSPMAPRNDAIAEVLDTKKPVDDLYVHHVLALADIKTGDAVTATIDSARRDRIRANHSATHLLHKALREVLGEHVTQKGSLVAPDKLRFDFSHPKPMTREEIAEVEARVNRAVWRNTPVSVCEMAPDDAIEAGAMALFGEKYGDTVRVLSMGEPGSAEPSGSYYSIELCGGTHVRNTGDIGLFKILSEGAVAAGIRRIEAVTHAEAFAHLSGMENVLRDVASTLKSGIAELPARIEQLSGERKKLEKEVAELKKQIALGGGGAGAPEKETVGNYALVSRLFDDLPAKELRNVASDMLKQSGADIGIAASAEGGKAAIVVALRKEVADTLNAVELVRHGVAAVGGQGGGGKPDLAQGGGPEGGKLASALEAIKQAMA